MLQGILCQISIDAAVHYKNFEESFFFYREQFLEIVYSRHHIVCIIIIIQSDKYFHCYAANQSHLKLYRLLNGVPTPVLITTTVVGSRRQIMVLCIPAFLAYILDTKH